MKEALISVIIIAGWLAKYMKETRLSAFLYMGHCSAMSNLKIRFRDCSTDSDQETAPLCKEHHSVIDYRLVQTSLAARPTSV